MSTLDKYKGKRVLITGHTGFKGSWLSLMLSEAGAHVLGYALDPDQKDDHYNLINIKDKISDVRSDLRDYEILRRTIAEFQPEIVFHLAAQAIVLESYRIPRETFDINIQGTVNVLECCRNCSSVKSVLIVTSDKCYDNKEWIWGYRENDRLGGYDPYSASKACAEMVTDSYTKSFGEKLGIASVRAGNVIGGGDWSANRIVPDSIRALMQKEDIVIRNPLSTRPWQHVLDPLYAYAKLAIALLEERGKYMGAWNVGPSQSSMRSVRELVDKIIGCWGSGKWVLDGQAGAPHEARALFLDITKIVSRLHWAPVWDFNASVRKTVEWYQAYANQDDMAEASRAQVTRFLQDARDAD